MAYTEHNLSKQGPAVIIRDITLTLPDTREIFTKPESATSNSANMATQNNGIKKHNEISPAKTQFSSGAV